MKTIMFALLITLITLSTVVGTPAQGQGTTPPQEDILQELLDLTVLPEQIRIGFTEGFKMKMEDWVAPAHLDALSNEVWTYLEGKGLVDYTRKTLGLLYAEHFSPEELEGLVEFYRTPVGKKAVEVQGKMLIQQARTLAWWIDQHSAGLEGVFAKYF